MVLPERMEPEGCTNEILKHKLVKAGKLLWRCQQIILSVFDKIIHLLYIRDNM